MGFYTANWVRKLIKEEASTVQKAIEKESSGLRTFIDNTLPFTTYLDIAQLNKTVLSSENDTLFETLRAVANLTDIEQARQLVREAYVGVINYYINSTTLKRLTSKELEDLLAQFKDLYLSKDSSTKIALATVFKNTYVLSDASRKNSYVTILSPKFKTISSSFGDIFKQEFIKTKAFKSLSGEEFKNTDGSVQYAIDSPKRATSDFINSNFKNLQNLGHIEVDIISSSSGTEVKRGLVSPRLIQALLSLPKDVKPETLARKFSKETGQASTRVIVRKKYSGTKLVLEMLIEAGIMIGSPESVSANLQKSQLEKAFEIGKNFRQKVLKDKEALKNLETSKSIKQYVAESVIRSIKGEKPEKYFSSASISNKQTVSVEVVKLGKLKKGTKTVTQKSVKSRPISKKSALPSLEALLRSKINQTVASNMGTGSNTKVLNYRTGRFSDSVKVERLSQSRAGMISVFYSYMKNPYATFSDGGRQQNPKSRDPKLLIAKSIRQIAAEMAVTNLRSINI